MLVVYNVYPTSCVHFIPESWRRDRKHTTIICNHKPWNILFITCFNTIFIFTSLHNFRKFPASFQHYCVIIHCDVIAVVFEKKVSICRHRSGIWKIIPWVISTGYVEKHVINHDISQLQMYYVFQNNVAFVSFFSWYKLSSTTNVSTFTDYIFREKNALALTH